MILTINFFFWFFVCANGSECEYDVCVCVLLLLTCTSRWRWHQVHKYLLFTIITKTYSIDNDDGNHEVHSVCPRSTLRTFPLCISPPCICTVAFPTKPYVASHIRTHISWVNSFRVFDYRAVKMPRNCHIISKNSNVHRCPSPCGNELHYTKGKNNRFASWANLIK